MQKCLNSSPWASRMIAVAASSGSIARRCSYQPIASASSVSEAQRRAKVLVSAGSSSGGSWYWSNPTATSFQAFSALGRLRARRFSLISRLFSFASS